MWKVRQTNSKQIEHKTQDEVFQKLEKNYDNSESLDKSWATYLRKNQNFEQIPEEAGSHDSINSDDGVDQALIEDDQKEYSEIEVNVNDLS